MSIAYHVHCVLRAALAAAVLATASVATAEGLDGMVIGGPEEMLPDPGFDPVPGPEPFVDPGFMVPAPMVPPMVVDPFGPAPLVPPHVIGPVGPMAPPLVVTTARPVHQPYRLGFRGVDVGWGVEIVSLDYGGAAVQLGLEPGDVIVELNGRRVMSINDYHAIMARSGGFVQLVVRDHRTGNVVQMPAFTLAQPGSVACAVEGP